MLEALKPFIEIQEDDMKLIQLMHLKNRRVDELRKVRSIQEDLKVQVLEKEGEILELKKNIRLEEGDVETIVEKLKKLEKQQSQIKKVEEFNALTHEVSSAERERHAKEQKLSDHYDRLTEQEEILKSLQETLEQTTENSRALETEIHDSIDQINEEGVKIKEQRDVKVEKADPEIFHIYERLLRNKKDRVIVPIENRSCSGCHITLTAQDENLVRKGERLIFCEHCSRIHFWPEAEELEGTAVATKRRRRKA